MGGTAGGIAALALAETASLVGTRMSGVAVGFAVYAATGRAGPLLLFAFWNEVPTVLGGSLGGAAVDRGDPRRLAILADAGQALGSLALLLAFLSGAFETWMLYAVGFWQGCCALVGNPAGSVLAARLAAGEHRDRVNSLFSMAFPAASLAAPALAGLLYPLIGIAGIVAIDLGTFLVAAAVRGSLRLPSAEPASSQAEHPGLRGGFLALRGAFRTKPALALLLAWTVLLNFLYNGPLDLLLPLSLARTGDARLAGMIISLQGLGGILGSAFLAARGRVGSRPRSLALGMGGTGLLMVAASLVRSPLLLGAAVLGAFSTIQTWSRFASIWQVEVRSGLRGRFFALEGQLGALGATSSFALTGLLVDRVLEPAARGGWGGAALPSLLFGAESGGGMALTLAAAGAAVVLTSLAVALHRGIGRLGARR